MFIVKSKTLVDVECLFDKQGEQHEEKKKKDENKKKEKEYYNLKLNIYLYVRVC